MAEPKRISPLSDSDYQAVQQVLSNCAAFEEFLGQCENCDLDVKEAKERVAANRRFCEQVKKQFFPDRV